MNIVNTGTTYRIFGEELKTFTQLPAQTYTVEFTQMGGFYLSSADNITSKEPKIYGDYQKKVDKVINRFENTNRNLGVILSGNKGIGKSLTAKLIAQKAVEKGYPVICVTEYIPGISDFLSSIKQTCVCLFDEFDKTFSHNRDNESNSCQYEMLSLFDGLDQGKKLFVITCNEISSLSDLLINRPGRFHYHFRFDYPSADEIREYLKDKISEKYYNQIEEVVSFSGRTDLNYDCLRAIALELEDGIPFKEAIKDLNILNCDTEYQYKVTVYFENGMKATSKAYVNFDNDVWDIGGINVNQLSNRVYITLDNNQRVYNQVEGVYEYDEDGLYDVNWNRGLSGNKVSNYDDCDYEIEKIAEDIGAKAKTKVKTNPKVVRVTLERISSYVNYHYSLN